MTAHNLAQNLKNLRTARDFTQTRLAEMLDVNPRVYNRWERGESTPHFDTLVQIADILQVSLDELAGRPLLTGDFQLKNHRLNALCQRLDELSEEDQKALMIMIDSLLKKQKMSAVMSE